MEMDSLPSPSIAESRRDKSITSKQMSHRNLNSTIPMSVYPETIGQTVTFVPQRTSTAKPLLNKRNADASKKLKKKLQQISDENESLAKLVNDKNSEIEDLKRSVQSLNDVLESVPVDELRTNSSIASNKILELSKKNRQLRIDLDAKKVLISKRDIQVQKLEREVRTLMEKLEKNDIESQKDSNPLAELQAKFTAMQQKYFETRNKNVELQEKLKLAGKCLQQEIGDSFDLSKLNTLAAQNTCNWRGRAQQIINLQQTINELKARIELLEHTNAPNLDTNQYGYASLDTLSLVSSTSTKKTVLEVSGDGKTKSSRSINASNATINFDRLTPSVRKSEIMHRAKVEELEKLITTLKAQLEEQRSKMLAVKVRNKTLNEEMLRYKAKANSLTDTTGINGMNVAAMNEQMHLQRYEYENRIDHMGREIKELKQHCAELQTREEELRQKLANTEDTLLKRTAYVAELEETARKLEEDMKSICGDFLFSCRELRKEEFVAILDSLETEKNYLLDQSKIINKRLEDERAKCENLTEQLSKQKLRNARSEGRVRELEKELESSGEKNKRRQRITDYSNNLSAKNSAVNSIVFENSKKLSSSSTTLCGEELGKQINELKHQLEFSNEKITMLEDRLSHLNAEKQKDLKSFEEAIVNSKRIILETIFSFRGGSLNSSCVSLDLCGLNNELSASAEKLATSANY